MPSAPGTLMGMTWSPNSSRSIAVYGYAGSESRRERFLQYFAHDYKAALIYQGANVEVTSGPASDGEQNLCDGRGGQERGQA
jgi:hypothetical protein